MATRRYRRKSAKGTRKSMGKLKKKTTIKRGGYKDFRPPSPKAIRNGKY